MWRAFACAVAAALLVQGCGGGGGHGGGTFVPTPNVQPTPPTPPAPTFNPTSFVALFHVAGDDFTGFSANPENAAYNDLKTQTDRARFLGDLIAGVNQVWAPTGVTLGATSAITDLPTAQVQALEPSLVVGGFTTVDAATGARWGNLGADSLDPTFGLAADVFLVQRGAGGAGGISPIGGKFEGRGTTHGAVFALFNDQGVPFPVSVIRKTMAHELGHFLGLAHTTETNFAVDSIADTPFCTAVANDTNKNGILDKTDDTALFPDGSNLMFPFGFGAINGPGAAGQITLTAGQGAAMRAYLTVTKH